MRLNDLISLSFLVLLLSPVAARAAIVHNPSAHTLTIADEHRTLELRVNYEGKCLLDRVLIAGRNLVPEETGVCSGIKASNAWFTTRAGLKQVHITAASNSVTISGLRFGGGGVEVEETWRFTARSDHIVWRIDRDYLSGGTLEDTYYPGWDFKELSTWTGALLGHGGVAWGKLFDAPTASYGVHNGTVAFWNKDTGIGLRLVPRLLSPGNIAVRFSRHPSGVFSLNYSVTDSELATRHGISRFRRDRQDIWAAFPVRPGRLSVDYTLAAFDYAKTYDLGVLKGVDTSGVREIRHTIARIGAVDERIHGSNGYYSDCAVLHEPWIAQLGLFIDDPDYTRALADTLDFQRQHAIGADGRVKSRWAGTAGDAMPGTYDGFGYYEAQWGYLLDSQPSWVINVAELFDLNGDRVWLARQKTACERVLDYMLRRDSDGNGLLEMLTDSCAQARGSDWIDVVWASYENALVNAQMYWAMSIWADCEQLLGDPAHADHYRAAAARLKARFNRSTREGGFWDPDHQCYAYWREKDGSVHGTNFVIPVNFSAIGYGLCDDSTRRAAILDRIESRMQQENLFFWPLCFYPYAPGEAHASQYPFPTYENGDLFLAWGELGTRCYAVHNPGVAAKYVKAVLAKYAQDGLAFQRYLRKTQTGAGNDILANNCSALVGLYRNLYGIQPRHNRLLLEPHLVPELNGTRLKYTLRGQVYGIDLSTEGCRVTLEEFGFRNAGPFAVSATGNTAQYFVGTNADCAMLVTRSSRGPVEIQMETWSTDPEKARRWAQSGSQTGLDLQYVITGLKPGGRYNVLQSGAVADSLTATPQGRLEFTSKVSSASAVNLEIVPMQ